MGRKITDIYKEYRIQKTLADHMFRVTAVAALICDNLDEEINKKDLITACLLHDMGNIVKFDLSYFPEFNQPEGLEYWQNVQNEFWDKYGKNDHKATMKIMQELSIPEYIISYIVNMGFHNFCTIAGNNDTFSKIIDYSDNRVSPFGVVSYDERMEEGRKRYEHRPDFSAGKERDKFVACGREIEKQIFSKCKIKPEDITDEKIASIISNLQDFVIE